MKNHFDCIKIGFSAPGALEPLVFLSKNWFFCLRSFTIIGFSKEKIVFLLLGL